MPRIFPALSRTHIDRDLAYGPDPRQKLDVYLPPGACGTPIGTMVVFWHGGSWSGGDKRHYGFVGKALARRGYVVAIPNYRLYPQVVFPAFVEDAAQAVQWVNQAYRPQRMVLMGHSAGAYIAALLALEPAYLQATTGAKKAKSPAAKPPIAGFIGLSGPYDFTPWPKLQPIFAASDPYIWKPINLVRRPAPAFPALLVHGRLDVTVSYRNSVALARALRHAGGRVQLNIRPLAEHMGTIGAFLPLLRRVSTTTREVTNFLKSLDNRLD